MTERHKAPERHNAPSQSDQASERSKAEGERDTGADTGRDVQRSVERNAARNAERNVDRDTPGRDALRTGRGGLDPIELRDVRDETSEKHRRGEDVGASGLSNPTLAEQEEEQAERPPSKTRKSGHGT